MLTDGAKSLRYCCYFVIVAAILAALPAFFIPYGLPAEGDALNYRIPLLKWILRHHTYPNWPWTFVDDYPMLPELLMLPLFYLKASLARLVPLAAYLGTAFFSGKIAVECFPSSTKEGNRTQFWFVAACLLGLHPLLLQSNTLMTDNVATCFALGSLYFCLRREFPLAAVLIALATASKYMIGGCYLGFLFAALFLDKRQRKNPRFWIVFLLAGVGPGIFLLRNLLLNANPIYPIFNELFHLPQAFPFDSYGRGKSLQALFLLPYDLFFTNTFGKAIFDNGSELPVYFRYAVGYLFYFQMIVALVFFLWFSKLLVLAIGRSLYDRRLSAVFLFILPHFLCWWVASQQFRFLLLELVLLNVALLCFLYQTAPRTVCLFVSIATLASVTYVQKESWLIALGKTESFSESLHAKKARKCWQSVTWKPTDTLGFNQADGLAAFWDQDLSFVSPHLYFARSVQLKEDPTPDYIYDNHGITEIVGYQPWPTTAPCLFKRKEKI